MKRSKRISKIICFTLIATLFSVTVYATTYSSSIRIGYRSTMTGSGRSYKGNNHAIYNTLTSRDYNQGNNYCEYVLQRKDGWSYTDAGSKTLNLKTVGNKYTATYSNQSSSGTFRYYLTNRYISSDYRYTQVDGFDCNQVIMSSY